MRLPATGQSAWQGLVSSTINLLTTSTLSSDESVKAPLPLPKLASLLAALRITLPEVVLESFESMIGVIGRLVIGSVMQELGDFDDEDDVDARRKELAVERIDLIVELVSMDKFAAILREDDVFARVSDPPFGLARLRLSDGHLFSSFLIPGI